MKANEGGKSTEIDSPFDRSGRRGGLMVCALVPRIERSGFESWPGTLCFVLGQDTLLSQCPSPPRSINGYRRIVGKNLTNCWGVTCDGLASRPGGVEILLAASCYGNRDKLRPDEPVGSKRLSSLHFHRSGVVYCLVSIYQFCISQNI